jgi:hypothetical protein
MQEEPGVGNKVSNHEKKEAGRASRSSEEGRRMPVQVVATISDRGVEVGMAEEEEAAPEIEVEARAAADPEEEEEEEQEEGMVTRPRTGLRRSDPGTTRGAQKVLLLWHPMPIMGSSEEVRQGQDGAAEAAAEEGGVPRKGGGRTRRRT